MNLFHLSGHNVESVCEDNMSFDFTSFDVASCVEDCQACVEILMEKEAEGRSLTSLNLRVGTKCSV